MSTTRVVEPRDPPAPKEAKASGREIVEASAVGDRVAGAVVPTTAAAQGECIPIIYGTAKVTPRLIEKADPFTGAYQGFRPIDYALGDMVVSNGHVWRCNKAGAATLVTLSGAPGAWQASHAYGTSEIVQCHSYKYKCVQAGTSAASGGPDGTGAGITDGGAKWNWIPYVEGPRGGALPWAQNTYYALGDYYFANGLSYKNTHGGNSAVSGTGPTGTGTGITDGSATWDYTQTVDMSNLVFKTGDAWFAWVQQEPLRVYWQSFVGALAEGPYEAVLTT